MAAAAPRRAAPPAPVAAAPAFGMFGDLGFYSGGGIQTADGDYLWEDLQCVMYTPTKANGQPSGKAAFLSAQLSLVPVSGAESDDDRHILQYSMGQNAHLSWMPDPDTGTKIIPVPGGPASGLNNLTNWAQLVKSLYDAGLPEGVFTDDLAVLIGLRCHMANIEPPDARKALQTTAKTGENAEAQQQQRNDNKILVVQEILDGGAPWDGGGGPIAKTAVAAKPGARAVAARPAAAAAAPVAVAANRAAARTVARVAAPAPVAPPVAAEADDEKLMIDTVSDILGASPAGMAKLKLRAACFKAITDAVGDAPAQAIMDSYWVDDATISAVLNQLGYGISGAQVKPM